MKIWRKHDPRVMDVEFRGCTKEDEVWRGSSGVVAGWTMWQVLQEGSLGSMVGGGGQPRGGGEQQEGGSSRIRWVGPARD